MSFSCRADAVIGYMIGISYWVDEAVLGHSSELGWKNLVKLFQYRPDLNVFLFARGKWTVRVRFVNIFRSHVEYT